MAFGNGQISENGVFTIMKAAGGPQATTMVEAATMATEVADAETGVGGAMGIAVMVVAMSIHDSAGVQAAALEEAEGEVEGAAAVDEKVPSVMVIEEVEGIDGPTVTAMIAVGGNRSLWD